MDLRIGVVSVRGRKFFRAPDGVRFDILFADQFSYHTTVAVVRRRRVVSFGGMFLRAYADSGESELFFSGAVLSGLRVSSAPTPALYSRWFWEGDEIVVSGDWISRTFVRRFGFLQSVDESRLWKYVLEGGWSFDMGSKRQKKILEFELALKHVTPRP